MGVVVRIFRNNSKIDLDETTNVLVSILNELKYSLLLLTSTVIKQLSQNDTKLLTNVS